MKSNINPEGVFAELRVLPLEVSFEQVEHWVTNFSPKPNKPNNWFPLFLTKLFPSSKN